jgi:hypothetical protein
LNAFLESQKMQRFRLSSSFIQFTSPSETAVDSDYETDNQPEQRLAPHAEVIRVANLLDLVSFVFSKIKNKFFFVIILYLGTHYCY